MNSVIYKDAAEENVSSAEQTDNNKYMKVDINLLLIGKEYD